MSPNSIHLVNVHAAGEGWEITGGFGRPFRLRMLDGTEVNAARLCVSSRRTLAARMAAEFLREHAPAEYAELQILDPQVQCSHLSRADFLDTGTVNVTTRKASGFKVTRVGHSGAWYQIAPCPTFPRGRLLTGLRTLQRTLESE